MVPISTTYHMSSGAVAAESDCESFCLGEPSSFYVLWPLARSNPQGARWEVFLPLFVWFCRKGLLRTRTIGQSPGHLAPSPAFSRAMPWVTLWMPLSLPASASFSSKTLDWRRWNKNELRDDPG